MKAALQSLPQSHFNITARTGTSLDADADASTSLDAKAESPIGSDNIVETLKVALTHVHNVSNSMKENAAAATRVRTADTNSNADENTSDACTGASGTHDQQDGVLPKYGTNYVIPGGCPFKTQYGHNERSFVDVMEEFSLFGLMGELIIQQTASTSTSTAGQSLQLQSQVSPVASLTTSTSAAGQSLQLQSQASPVTSTTMGGMKRSKSGTSLSSALKHGTQESHSAAESVHFIKEFIKGNIDKTLYSILIQNLYFLYEALEPLLDEHAPTCFPTVHFPKELSRTQALKDDVDFYYGERALNLESNESASTATLDYLSRIEYIAQEEPLLLLSHAYTRYLGDLSGGKILARVARRALKLQDADEGLAFYQFDEISSAKVFKDDYRRALDELSLREDEIERLVAEANVAFVLNMRIFEELDVLNGIAGAQVQDYEAAVAYYEQCVKKQQMRNDGVDMAADEHEAKAEAQPSAKCPFAMLGGPNPHKTPQKETKPKDVKEEKRSNTVPTIETVNAKPSVKEVEAPSSNGAKERCPWPFVFIHDPQTGMKDYQTWIVLGLLLCCIWSLLQKQLV